MTTPIIISLDTCSIKKSRVPENTKQEHIDHINNYNLWEKGTLNKIGLEKWKILRKRLPWCQEGKVTSTSFEVPCILVSITVLEIVRSLEEAIQELNQSAEKVSLKEQTIIITGSDYKTV